MGKEDIEDIKEEGQQDGGQAMLSVEHLVKRFGTETILDDISFRVNPGEVLVIVGPSGCGKSTLLRCINALEDVQGGKILLNGLPVAEGGRKSPSVGTKIGMVFQSYDLFPHLNVIDNITLAPCKVLKKKRFLVEAEARELLKRVGLEGKEKSYPRELSGGQKQRVAIVRAMCMHPEILLLDEITAALDPEMVREVLEVVLDLARQGMTMLIVTHEMSFARAIATKVMMISDGHVVEEGTPEEFFTAPKTARARQFLNTFTYESVR